MYNEEPEDIGEEIDSKWVFNSEKTASFESIKYLDLLIIKLEKLNFIIISLTLLNLSFPLIFFTVITNFAINENFFSYFFYKNKIFFMIIHIVTFSLIIFSIFLHKSTAIKGNVIYQILSEYLETSQKEIYVPRETKYVYIYFKKVENLPFIPNNLGDFVRMLIFIFFIILNFLPFFIYQLNISTY